MSMPTIEIIEIIEPSPQGKTRPYKCRGDDGKIYYVKGRQTDRASLCHEFICGHLAKEFGLTIPPFAIVNISNDLLREAPNEWQNLGTGLAFGSCQHANPIWLEVSAINKIDKHVQRDVLVFDWWIRNEDRSTGNSNLLLDTSNQSLVVIDHNLAFDKSFSVDNFINHHIFSDNWTSIFEDLFIRDQYINRLSKIMVNFQTILDNVPDEWRWANDEMDLPAAIDFEFIKNTLNRCSSSELWST
jgi:hypothetical protein